MHWNREASVVGLTVQWGGVAITTILSFLMAQSSRRRFLEYWTLGWAFLVLGLTSALIAFSLPVPPRFLDALRFFGEYGFAFLFLAGCRNLVSGFELRRAYWWLTVPAALLAVGVAYLAPERHAALVPHAAVLCIFWVLAYCLLRPARCQDLAGAGLRVLWVGALMMALNCGQYIVAFGYTSILEQIPPFAYLNYRPLIELLLETVLAFGTVIVLMERLCRHLEGRNLELATTSAQLQALLEQDPLSQALNRHAFDAYLRRSREDDTNSFQGCVAIVDVDDFKSINDTLGHAAGDEAIRAVARSIRSVIRAADLVFRWGGDEFLVVLSGVGEEEGRMRMARLNTALAGTVLMETSEPIDLEVSFGIASFVAAATLEQTIEQADREMYNQKQARKARALSPTLLTPLPPALTNN